MKIVLIHPPLDDPTIPYHATACLAGHLRANGFEDVAMRDVNIEYVDYCLQSDTIRWIYEETDRRIAAFRGARELSYADQEAYFTLLARPRVDAREILDAASTLRRKDGFLDYSRYLKSVRTLAAYMGVIGALCYPAEYYEFQQGNGGRISRANLDDLLNESLSERVCLPFRRYFQEHIVGDPDFATGDLFGVSIVYDHQLFQAIYFARLLKKQWPDKQIVLGGPAITQMYKYMLDKNGMKRLFDFCDAVVVGEGETAICEIAAADGRINGRQFTNTITWSKVEDRLHIPEIRHEEVSSLGAPIYDHPWHLYLSPERGVNYSPTRGCYWNRCTFCDYGLNTNSPTTPWRERPIAQVIEDLRNAVATSGIHYVYFAVDVMAPAYLERLSDAIMEAGLDIKWAAELRMERVFTLERAEKMRRAGCVCVSFGMESASQRLLDLMDKGTRVEYMAATLKNFAAAGIACQLMVFADFPTETRGEKAATLEYIRESRELWSTGGVGAFVLTGTSMVAREPEKFGISIVERSGADIRKVVAYRVDSEEESPSQPQEADRLSGNHAGVFPEVLFRPWAGGTDTLHTMIYFDTYGRNFFKNSRLHQITEVEELSDEEICGLSVTVNGSIAESEFDLGEIVKNRRLYPVYIRDRVLVPAEPTFSAFQEWANSVAPVASRHEPGMWIVLEDKCGRLNELAYRLLQPALREPIPVGTMLGRCPENIRPRVLTYLKDLESNGFISFTNGDHVIRKASNNGAPRTSDSPRPLPTWKLPAKRDLRVEAAAGKS